MEITMNTLNVEQAAGLLHLNVKRVQAMARAGKLPAVRVGRKWLFPREQLESILGCPVHPHASLPLAISARNHLRGRVTRLHVDGLMAEVNIRIGDQEVVAVITRSSAERLGLKIGDEAFAIIKSTEIMVGKQGAGE
jgi:molybdopterin-binding protein